MKLVDPKITVLMVVEVDRDSATTRGKDKTENDFGLSPLLSASARDCVQVLARWMRIPSDSSVSQSFSRNWSCCKEGFNIPSRLMIDLLSACFLFFWVSVFFAAVGEFGLWFLNSGV